MAGPPLGHRHPQQRLISPMPHLPPKGGIWACELKTLTENVDSVLTHPIWGENLNRTGQNLNPSQLLPPCCPADAAHRPAMRQNSRCDGFHPLVARPGGWRARSESNRRLSFSRAALARLWSQRQGEGVLGPLSSLLARAGVIPLHAMYPTCFGGHLRVEIPQLEPSRPPRIQIARGRGGFCAYSPGRGRG